MSAPSTDPALTVGPQASDAASQHPEAAQPATLAHTLDASAAAPPLATPSLHLPGYEVLGELGRGGMGVVYRARQLALGRTVALKMILAAEHAGAAQVARFRSEAEALARLQHPHIVQIYEIGEHDGRPFFSLEHVDGGSLDRKLDGTPLPPRQAAKLIEALARAVHAAHERGVVHRDLKPGNILLTADGTPKITDFGLAKQLDGSAAQTQTGAVLGTPSYMAPEQAGGHKGQIGPATDVWALGAILYELLTGRPPFRGLTPLETLLQVMETEPVPPARLQPKLPRDLETICLKCLQKEPRKRYGSALDLAEDLRHFQAGEPIQARPAGTLERVLKWARRRPAVAALSAAVVLVTVLGFAGVTAALLAVDRQRQMAEDSNAEMYRVNQQLLAARASLERANAATKTEAANALQAKRAVERSAYFSNVALAQQLWQGNSVARAREALERCPAEFRDWEWRYLHRLCRAELATHPGDPGMGEQLVALSPDGRILAVSNGDKGTPGRLRLREAIGGRVLHELHLDAPIHALVFHRDGKRLALALDGAVAICELGPQPRIRQVGDQQTRYRCVVWTVDGRLLAAGYASPRDNAWDSESGDVEVWDAEAGKKLWSLPGFHGAAGMAINARAMALSPDGRRLAAAAVDTGIRSGRASRGAKRPDQKPAGPPPRPALKDRPHPVSAFQGQIKVWNLVKVREERVVDGGVNALSDLAFSPDGRFLAWGNAAAVSVLDLDGGQAPRVFTGAQHDVHAVAFSPDGRRLAAGGADSSLRVWDRQTGAEEFALRGHAAPVAHAAFSGDGRRLASAATLLLGLSSEVKVWDVTDGPEARTARGPAGHFSYCTGLNAVTRRYGVFQGMLGEAPVPEQLEFVVRSLDDHRPLFRLPCKGEEALLFGFSPDGKRLAGASPAEIQVLDAATGKVAWTAPLPPQGREALPFPTRVAMSKDGRLLAFAWVLAEPLPPGKPPLPEPAAKETRKLELTVGLWDAQTGKPLGRHSAQVQAATPRTSMATVTTLAFRPDGKQLAAVVSVFGGGGGEALALGGEIQLWDTTALRRQVTRGCAHALFSGTYSPDGRLFAAGGGTLSEGRVVVWDTGDGSERLRLRGHTKDVLAVAFSPAGNRLVTGGGDRLLKLWDMASGQEVLTLSGHRRSVTAVAFSPDGSVLYSATGFGLLDLAAMENVATALRLPMEVKTWDAPR